MIYQISVDGDDRNPTGPWRTIDHAIAQCAQGLYLPGDEILLRSGDTFAPTGYLTVEGCSGVPELPIKFASYGTGPRPVIDFQFSNYWLGRRPESLPADYITIADLEVRNVARNGMIQISGTGWTLNNLHLHDTIDAGG